MNTPGHRFFSPGQTASAISVPLVGDTLNEGDETFFVTLSNPSNVTIVTERKPPAPFSTTICRCLDFTRFVLHVRGKCGQRQRCRYPPGDTSVAVQLTTPPATWLAKAPATRLTAVASARRDYETTAGTLSFAVGETSKTINIPIVDDSYAEGLETFSIGLSDPAGGGAVLIPPSAVTIRITDNETANGTNPIDQANFFVRMHYVDFLNREPDPAGLSFWSNQITECQQPGATCSAEVRRINVSAAFFLSIEFQETGYLVYRFYKSAYGNIVWDASAGAGLSEFLPDTQQIGKGVVIGQPGADQLLESQQGRLMRWISFRGHASRALIQRR